jgi:hypothetical protein
MRLPARLTIATAALVLAAAPGTAGQRDRDKVPAATALGKPVNCLRLTDIRESRVRSDGVIDFYTRSGKVYRNHLDGGSCPGLGFEKRYLHKTVAAELCSYDTITVLQSPDVTRGASCGLGSFEPVQLAKR